MAADFFEDVEDTGEILLGAFELGFGETAFGFEAGDAGSFFDDGAAVSGAGGEDLADAALLDDGVGFRSEAGAHEDVLDVAETGLLAVDEIFTVAGAEQSAGDNQFAAFFDGLGDEGGDGAVGGGEIHQRKDGVDGGIEKGEGDAGHAHGLAVAGAGKDDIFHAGSAEAFGGLFTEDPVDGVAQVGFAAAVRPDDGGDASATEA